MSYEELYGKARLPDPSISASYYDIHGRHVPAAGALVLHDSDGTVISSSSLKEQYNASGAANGVSAVPPIRSYAEWYLEHTEGLSGAVAAQEHTSGETRSTTSAMDNSSTNNIRSSHHALPLRSIVTAEHFKQLSLEGGRRAEADLWSLLEDLLLDAERAPRYDPSVIGIASTPPQRRWFLSHYAYIQDMLMRRPLLRRATIVCGWLERTYRNTVRQPRLRGNEEVVLRQLLLTYLRGGELYKAIDAAIACGDSGYSCVLSAAQLQTVKEPWLLQTAVVPLFGEYAHGELDQSWCGNEHRLDNLAQLFEDSQSDARPGSDPRHSFDAVISAALCGNLEVLEPAFAVSKNWRDVAWCYLRCALTTAFSKALMDAGAMPAETGGDYRAFLERQTGSDDDWLSRFEWQLADGLTQRLMDGFLAKAPLEEQLMMRVALQMLSPLGRDGDSNSHHYPLASTRVKCWLDVDLPAPTAQGPGWGNSAREYREAGRLLVHLLLVLDAAYAETLSEHAVQAACGDTLAAAMSTYAVALANLPDYRFDAGMMAVIALARRLRDHRHRASVYTAFLSAARAYELEHQTLSRERLEEQEAQLVRLFVEADPDPAVHAEVQRLLNGQVPAESLLTHNPVAERILWEAMHATTPQDYLATLRRGLEACVEFWLMTHPGSDEDAIADVSRTLTRRVLPFLRIQIGDSQPDDATAVDSPALVGNDGDKGAAAAAATTVSSLEASEATFWYLFSEVRDLAQKHAAAIGQLGAARATTSTDRGLLFQLAEDEAALMRRLVETAQRAVRHGGAVVVGRSRDAVTAIVTVVKRLAEEVTLSLMGGTSFLSAAAGGAEISGSSGGGGGCVSGHGVAVDALGRMQSVLALVEELDEAGYLDPSLLPQACAADLYRNIVAMRVTYGQRVHRHQVRAAVRQAQAGSTSAAVAIAAGGNAL